MHDQNEEPLTRLLDPADGALDQLYLDFYAPLKRYAFTMLNDQVAAEEMVQQVFFKVLERSGPIRIHTSVKAYLYKSVNHECLNYIKQPEGPSALQPLLHPEITSKIKIDNDKDPVCGMKLVGFAVRCITKAKLLAFVLHVVKTVS